MEDRGGRLEVLDGLRGLAIASVVWYHVWQISWLTASVTALGREWSVQFVPETGFLGVELFFFLSGFVLFWPYARAALAGAPEPSLRHFAFRRALKIAPSYYFAIAVLLALGARHYPSFAAGARDVALHALFLHNWFADTYGSIDGVMWSLGVEVQFYAIFPLVAWAFRRRPLLAFAAMCALAVAWRVAAVQWHWDIVGQLQGQLPAALDVFACGMLAAWLTVLLRTRHPALAARRALWTVLSLGAAAAVIALLQDCFRIRYDDGSFAHWKALHVLPLGVAYAAFAVAALHALPSWRAVVANRALVFLAAISYNLYLWHQVIARAFVAWGWPAHAGPDAHDDPRWKVLFTIVSMGSALAVATVLTYGLERPLLRWRPHRAKPHAEHQRAHAHPVR
jgi:peptidoglycan/LPS O-acetylase OafA/YrhL